jgi:hypothetical protein
MMDGRRLYIHEHSLLQAILEGGPVAAEVVVGGLARTAAAKIVHHTFAVDGVALGLVEARVGERLDAALAAGSRDALTTALHRLELRGHRGDLHRGWRLLGDDEAVVASCVDSGYFTFATGDRAAIRMYADTCTLRGLRAAVNIGAGPSDLQVIKGRSLRFSGASRAEGEERSVVEAWMRAIEAAHTAAEAALADAAAVSEESADLAQRALRAHEVAMTRGFFAIPKPLAVAA